MAEPSTGARTERRAALDALAVRIRRLLGVDVASVAQLDDSGVFVMSGHDGARADAYRSLHVSPGAGLGGLVAASGEPVVLRDYARSGRITGDYRSEVSEEGLRGLTCVPVRGPTGATLLIYAGNRTDGDLGDRRLGRLEGIADELGSATETVAAAVAGERERLAVRLHDTVAQVLFAIAADAETSLGTAGRTDAALARIVELARAGRADLRCTFAELAGDTSPQSGPDGVAEQIVAAAEGTIPADVTIHWLMRGEPVDPDPEAVALAVDVAREGVRNALRHSDAHDILATVATDRHRLLLCIQSPAPQPVSVEPAPGSGLSLLAGRANRHGGSLRVTVHPDGPQALVTVRLELPVGSR